MAILDLICQCGNFIEDYFICTGFIPDGWVVPNCEKCGTQMQRSPSGLPHIDLYTSDLPHSAGGSGFEGYQPAFNKVTHSKRDTMSALHDFNRQEKELADEAGRPFQEFEWQPEPSQRDKEFESMRKELGADKVNSMLSKQHDETMTSNLEKKLAPAFEQLSAEIGDTL
jgi:hypothetical protein